MLRPNLGVVMAMAAAVAASSWGGAAFSAPSGSPDSVRAAGATIKSITTIQYFWGGYNYCWYDNGWHGPGWYVCNYGPWIYGSWWGGPIGWHHWRWHGPIHPGPFHTGSVHGGGRHP
jgi:hypothetical protein